MLLLLNSLDQTKLNERIAETFLDGHWSMIIDHWPLVKDQMKYQSLHVYLKGKYFSNKAKAISAELLE